jgi:nanoRNase/pAp phosphatase (c-di-AMP/oligoRNAs hydrolase)
MNKFADFVSNLEGQHILHLMHRDADCDALGSAYCLSTLIPGTLGVFGDLKTSARDLAETLGVEVDDHPDVIDFDYVIIYDTVSPDMVGGPLPERFALIDHHIADGHIYANFTNTLAPYAERVWLEPLEATCSVLWELLHAADLPISRRAGLAILAGIVTDTGWLMVASPECFERIAAIMAQSGLTLAEVYHAIDGDLRRKDRRRAVLEALQTVQEVEVSGLLLLAGKCDTHDHGFALSSLLARMGADVRMVAFPKTNQTMVMAETDGHIVHLNDLDLEKIFQSIGSDISGSQTWGTKVLGRIIAPVSVDALFKRCVDAITIELSI